jgi:hypothetical protein
MVSIERRQLAAARRKPTSSTTISTRWDDRPPSPGKRSLENMDDWGNVSLGPCRVPLLGKPNSGVKAFTLRLEPITPQAFDADVLQTSCHKDKPRKHC